LSSNERLTESSPPAQRLLITALADELTCSPLAAACHERHEFPAKPSLQVEVEALLKREIIGRTEEGEYQLIEPFLAEWLHCEEQRRGAPRAAAERRGR
jgi:hypothetical protein